MIIRTSNDKNFDCRRPLSVFSDDDTTIEVFLYMRRAFRKSYWEINGRHVWEITCRDECITLQGSTDDFDVAYGVTMGDVCRRIAGSNLTPTAKATRDWNATCIHCGAPAYQGFMSIECSRRCGGIEDVVYG